jgi:type III restriction enzyme
VARLELLDFQQDAVTKLFETALGYFESGGDVVGGRKVPFVGQLKAVTGAGKTPILANIFSRLRPAIVLWTTKFGSVVDQTAINLSSGGKYNHLLGMAPVQVIKFSDIPSSAAWQRILEQKDGLTILISTVAAWNSTEKDERLNVHRVHPDWGDKSRWEQLKTDRQQPLWVVYDEAHNTTTEQVELLDDLFPSGFFVASASPIKGKLQQYLTLLSDENRRKRIVAVRTRDVVDAQLLKSVISVADYDSPTEEMIGAVVERRKDLGDRLQELGSSVVPKAIYVVETSNVSKGAEPRPTAIWRVLTKQFKVPASEIAVCTNTKELPKDAVRVKTIEELSEQFTHIIFNKKLQEGWDDPAVYVCYFDGKTDSATRIQQVIGRALRQPDGHHLADEDLNTAYFFVNCPNEALEGIVDELKEELRIYRDDDEPDDWEPFQFKEERKALPKIPLRKEVDGKLKLARLQLELPSPDVLSKLLKKRSMSLNDEDRAAAGRALISVVSVRTGDVEQRTIDLLENMRIACGTFLQEQIRMLSKNCLNAMDPALFTTDKLNQTACYKSIALEHYRMVAGEIVAAYENHVQLTQLADDEQHDYLVGPYQPSGTVKKPFINSGHTYYDNKAFNNDELDFAKALDKHKYSWVRNKDRVDYGIPLPIKSGSSSQFFPDFLWWVRKTIWSLDTTGKFILDEKIRTKLLHVPPPLRIGLVVRGHLDATYKQVNDDGWTILRFRIGNAAPECFDDLDDLLQQLVSES